MANYSDIKGFTDQTLSTDTIASQFAGGSWASGGNMNEGRVAGAGSGTQTASIFAGGTPPTTADVELYNGSSWTETTEMNTARAELAAATVAPSTAALIFAGHTGTYPTQNASDANEYWNGSSWTELAEVNTGRWATAGAGASYTAALLYGGYNGSDVNNTETWNGSAWTEVNELNTTRRYLAGTGSNTAAIAIGGSPGLNTVEQWDGSNWTATTNFPTGSEYIEAAGASYTNCLALGVTPSSTGKKTVHWDGSSWTELSDYTTGRINGVGTGSSSAALLSGGNPSPVNASTEEFTAPSDFVQQVEGQIYFNSTTNTFKETITDIPGATWASGGNLNEGRNAGSSAGTQTSALFSAGDPASAGTTNNTEAYDGTSWTEVNELNTARRESSVGSGLSNSAALNIGGWTGSARLASNEKWDGTNWTEVGDMNEAAVYVGSSGSSTSALAWGGSEPSVVATAESWDGTSWSEVADMSQARYGGQFCSGQSNSSAIVGGGYHPSATNLAVTEIFDGSSWTEVGDLNSARAGQGGTVAGGTTSGLTFGGGPSPTRAKTEAWNGTAWTEVNDLSDARNQLGGAGSSSASALAFGGDTSTSTEEFTADLANKTITTS